MIFVAHGALGRSLKDTRLPRGETERPPRGVLSKSAQFDKAAIEETQGPSSFPRLGVIERRLAKTLLRPRRTLELFNERCLYRGLIRIHAHHREVAHLTTHAF